MALGMNFQDVRVKPPYGGGEGVCVCSLGPRDHRPGSLGNLDLGLWARAWDLVGPVQAWARDSGPPGPWSPGPGLGPGGPQVLGPRLGPGRAKKHDSTMKIEYFLQKCRFSNRVLLFSGKGCLAVFKNVVCLVLFS